MDRGSRTSVLVISAACAIAGCAEPRRAPVSPPPAVAVPPGAGSFEDVGSQVVLAAATTYPRARVIADEAPVSLTASDGTGLRLVRYSARAAVHGPLAFTELHLSFANPDDRVLEGRFQLTLPEGAAISRLAMKTSSGWQEAEVVELSRARQVYEDFLHRAQDPALLEREAGNQFRARIFPIPARATKELIVSFSQELASPAAAFELPLRGLPRIDAVDIAAAVVDATGRRRWTRLQKRGWVPDQNFSAPRAGGAQALRAGDLFASYVVPAGGGAREPIEAVTFAFDTSASRAPGFARSVDQLAELVAALARAGDPEIAVLAFDQETAPIYAGKASGFGAAERRRLLARRPLGASDLGRALRAAGAAGHRRVVVFGDGVATAGAREPAALVAIARELAVDRLDVIVRGGIRDRDAAAALATAGNGAVLDADRMGGAELAKKLGERVGNHIEVSARGARWVWPDRLDGVMAGEARVIYGQLRRPDAELALRAGSRTVRPAAAQAPRALLTRAVARAEIARLEARLAAMGADAGQRAETTRQRIIAVSTSQRVLSRFTGLLVLETEEDYRRFGIERTSLADILTIDPDGEVIARSRDQLVIAERPPGAEPIDAGGKGKKKEAAKERPLEQREVVEAKPAPVLAPPPEPPAPEPASEESVSIAGRTTVENEIQVDSSEESDQSPNEAPDKTDGPPPISGTFATVREHIEAGRRDQALVAALAWQREEPGDVLALVALGEALEAAGHGRLAARAYGSIIDLFPSRADLRRYAGMRLARLEAGLALATDSFAAAVATRPDHLTGHRLLAYAHARAGRYDRAMAALEAGLERRYPPGRFAGGARVLAEDLAIIGAAWIAAEPAVKAAVRERLEARDLEPAGPGVRFVISWETDANDVDFHIHDARGGHASFRDKILPSGGELYADVTNGYGPECFAIAGKPAAAPYRLRAHYYSRGPMGYGIGQLEIVRWDGARLTVEARPFVVMNDGAYLELGSWAP